MDVRFGNAKTEQHVVLHAHERNRSADIIVSIFEEYAVLDPFDVDQARKVVVTSFGVRRQGLVVEDEKLEIRIGTGGVLQTVAHRMYRAVACAVHENDLPRRRLKRFFQHADHRRQPDPAADQNDRRRRCDVDVEVPVGSRELEFVADIDLVVQQGRDIAGRPNPPSSRFTEIR